MQRALTISIYLTINSNLYKTINLELIQKYLKKRIETKSDQPHHNKVIVFDNLCCMSDGYLDKFDMITSV